MSYPGLNRRHCGMLLTVPGWMLWGWVGVLGAIAPTPAVAQIVPDRSLPTPSRVDTNGNLTVITGGSRAGANLFHSFAAFSIGRGETASFRPDGGIDRIIARVTGGSISNLDGVLEVLQSGRVGHADLFLLNPNGVVIGPQASLNIGGSLILSTADRVEFADGRQFATNPAESSPLLTVSLPIGLHLGSDAGSIRHQSRAGLRYDPISDEPIAGGLAVDLGQTIALVGNGIDVEGGILLAPEGRVELGSVATGTVALTPIESGWQLGYDAVSQFADLTLIDDANVITSGDRSGAIQLRGDRLFVRDSWISATNFGAASGQPIEIGARRLTLDNGLISSFTEGTGRAASIRVDTGQLIGRSGGQLLSLTFGDGDTGAITVNATDIQFDGGLLDAGAFFPSGTLTQVGEGAAGDGGRVAIATQSLTLTRGAQISTTTFGRGDAGLLRVSAVDVVINGNATRRDGSAILQDGNPLASGLFSSAERTSTGNGNTLELRTARLTLSNGGLLQTATLSQGDAGDVFVRASEWLDVIGLDSANRFPSSINASSGGIPRITTNVGVPTATGRGGTVWIETPLLQVLEGGAIAVGSLNPSGTAAGAGDLIIRADTIRLDQAGRLLAENASGDGGNIDLTVQDVLILRNGSQISATAGTEQAGGNGGNLTIDSAFVLAVPSENSDIRANAFTGNGGSVTITSQSIIGLEPQLADTLNSDITASSEFGLNGVIQLNTPDVDPSRGLVSLPANLRDASRLVAQGCAGTAVASRRLGAFIVTGRGGLPSSPDTPIRLSRTQADWSELPMGDRSIAVHPISTTVVEDRPTPPLIEATGWSHNEQGQTQLVASAPTMPSIGSTGRSPTCH